MPAGSGYRSRRRQLFALTTIMNRVLRALLILLATGAIAISLHVDIAQIFRTGCEAAGFCRSPAVSNPAPVSTHSVNNVEGCSSVNIGNDNQTDINCGIWAVLPTIQRDSNTP